jgi:hypothetical protein
MPQTLDLEQWGLFSSTGSEQSWKRNPPVPDIDWTQGAQQRTDEDAIRTAMSRSTVTAARAIEALRQEIYRGFIGPQGLAQSYQPIYWYPYEDLRRTFVSLRDEWKAETSISSSTQDISMHPAYQRIIGLGRQAMPLLLRELQANPDQWFWALEAISRENPAGEDDDFDTRAQKWIGWGRERGYLPPA